MNEYHVSAFWDEEAKVWVTTSDDVPGLATEAETVELLLGKLRVMIPELLELSGNTIQSETPFHLHADCVDVARLRVDSFTPELKQILKKAGCNFIRALD